MSRLRAPERRQQLVDVGTKLFAKWGFECTTTAAIAQAAGVTEPILYRHFKNKQELFVAIVREMSQQTIDHWKELIKGINDPADQLRTIAEEFPHHLRRLDDAYRVIHGALATSRDRKVQAVIREHYAMIEDFFTSIIQAGQTKGNFDRQVQPKRSVWHMIYLGIGYMMISQNLPSLAQTSVEEGINFIIRGMT